MPRCGATGDEKYQKLVFFKLGAVVITCDEDFGRLVFEKGLPNAGVVKLSLRNNSAANQAAALCRALNRGQIAPGTFIKLSDADLR